MKPVYIYGLYDPETNALRYIGKTETPPLVRLAAHLCRLKERTPKSNWIKGLKREGLRPYMKIIAVANQYNWQALEKRYIAFFGLFHKLLNVSQGGELDNGRLLKDYCKNPDYLRNKIRIKRKRAISKYIGVTFKKRDGWVARCGNINIGNYDSEINAARAFDAYVLKNGLNWNLNFPTECYSDHISKGRKTHKDKRRGKKCSYLHFM